MIQAFLTKYTLPIHLALMASAVFAASCIPFPYAGIAGLILAFSAAEFVFLLPSVHTGETFVDARERVWDALVRDVFFYLGIAGLLVALSQWLNSGCSLMYVPGADVWQMSLPPARGLPFSVKGEAAEGIFFRLLAVFVAVCALRTAVGKRGKRFLFAALSCMSGILALILIVRTGMQSETVKANPVGFLFGFWAIVGFGAYFDACRDPETKRTHFWLALLGPAVNTVGGLYFMNGFWALVLLFLVSVLTVYGFFFLARQAEARQVMAYACYVLLFAGAAILILGYLLPENPIQRHYAFWLSGDFEEPWNAWAATWCTRMDTALAVWQGHVGWGAGVDGFREFLGFSVTGKAWAAFKVDPGLVYNDGLQLLCEYGIVGLILFLAAFLVLLIPIVFRCRTFLSQQGESKGALDRRDFLRLDPLFFTGALAVVSGTVQAWFASPFHAPGFCLSWMVVLASLPVFLPEADD